MPEIIKLAETLRDGCIKANLKIATAESCTGGMLAATITSLKKASKMFDRGFVTYATISKTEMLGVSKKTIADHEVVSGEVAKAMAKGVLKHSKADLAVGITGEAGPEPETSNKVGTVFIGVARRKGKAKSVKFHFSGGRKTIQQKAVTEAIRLLIGEL